MKEIADAGIKVIVAGSSVGELAMHYLNRFGIAVIKVLSKFELRRLCRVVNATPLARVGAPTPEETGFVDVFETIEIGGDRVTVLRQLLAGEPGFDPTSEGEKTRTATIVLRGATSNHLDDLERAVDDGVNVIKSLMKDARSQAQAQETGLEESDRSSNNLAGHTYSLAKAFAPPVYNLDRAEHFIGERERAKQYCLCQHVKFWKNEFLIRNPRFAIG